MRCSGLPRPRKDRLRGWGCAMGVLGDSLIFLRMYKDVVQIQKFCYKLQLALSRLYHRQQTVANPDFVIGDSAQ